MRDISRQSVERRLAQDNSWWAAPAKPLRFDELPRRVYFERFLKLVQLRSPRRAVVLMGPRRVGKTVLLHQAISALIKSGADPKSIAYVNLEVPLFNGLGLEDLVEMVRTATGVPESTELFVFFDEIQYLRNWEVHLKTLVDSGGPLKCVASGSSAAALRLKSNESGAGRFTDFLLPPILFSEYLRFLGLEGRVPGITEWKAASEAEIDWLNGHFVDYLNFGGYPEAIFSDEVRSDPGRFIRSDVIDKVLLRDLPSLYGIEDIQELNSLFAMLAFNTAEEISLEGLAQKSGVAKNTIKRYIEYLEAAFLIRVVHRVDDSGRRFKRANFFKVYLTNPSLRSALFEPLTSDDGDMGSLVETGLFGQWFHLQNLPLHYARWSSGQGEVDLVILDPNQQPTLAIEVKWTNRFFERPSELVSLRKFLVRHPRCAAAVTTRTRQGELTVDGRCIRFVPAAILALDAGSIVSAIESLRPSPP